MMPLYACVGQLSSNALGKIALQNRLLYHGARHTLSLPRCRSAKKCFGYMIRTDLQLKRRTGHKNVFIHECFVFSRVFMSQFVKKMRLISACRMLLSLAEALALACASLEVPICYVFGSATRSHDSAACMNRIILASQCGNRFLADTWQQLQKNGYMHWVKQKDVTVVQERL